MNHNPYHTCPYCHAVGAQRHSTATSTAGWIVAAVLFFVCIIFAWVPLIAMRENRTFCTACYTRLA